jgi:hypothetical protein
MSRRRSSVYTNYSLPEGSDALADLDQFCEEWGDISRADATRMLIIAWSKAKRGQFSELWGMSGSASSTPENATSTVATRETAPSIPATPPPTPIVRRRVSGGNASAVDLDL